MVLGAAIVTSDNCRHFGNMRPRSPVFQYGLLPQSNCPTPWRWSIAESLGSPLVRVRFAGSWVPVDPDQRMAGQRGPRINSCLRSLEAYSQRITVPPP